VKWTNSHYRQVSFSLVGKSGHFLLRPLQIWIPLWAYGRRHWIPTRNWPPPYIMSHKLAADILMPSCLSAWTQVQEYPSGTHKLCPVSRIK